MSLQSLIDCGTKVWSDSVDPAIIAAARSRGISGATSNPIIIADIIKAGGLDGQIVELIKKGLDDSTIAWTLNDRLVSDAQKAFMPVWLQTRGDDGYVSFELDPLLEDVANPMPLKDKVKRYVELAKQWSAGHQNRMIKIPATEGGLAALEEVAAMGVQINVTLVFSERQYLAAREAIWRGARKRKDGLAGFKSVYSIFVSRLDVYTEKHVPDLSPAAQGMVGIVNAKRLWRLNQEWWKDKNLPLKQEIVFASTGTKKKSDPPDKYVEAFAGSDIQTNPPATNDAVEKSGKTYARHVDEMPPKSVLDEIDKKVDMARLERVLMEEGLTKFAEPQKAMEKQIAERRKSLRSQ